MWRVFLINTLKAFTHLSLRSTPCKFSFSAHARSHAIPRQSPMPRASLIQPKAKSPGSVLRATVTGVLPCGLLAAFSSHGHEQQKEPLVDTRRPGE